MKELFLGFLMLGFITGCHTTETVIITDDQSQQEEAPPQKNTPVKSTFTSKGSFHDLVRDPIDYSSCSQKEAILYDGKYFCSQKSIEQYRKK